MGLALTRGMNTTKQEAIMEKRDRTIQVGTYVEPDGWRGFGENLEKGLDGFCDFYLTGTMTGATMAVNVKVTGRTIQRRKGDLWVRVQVTFVQEDDLMCLRLSPTTGGWVLAYETANEQRLAQEHAERKGS